MQLFMSWKFHFQIIDTTLYSVAYETYWLAEVLKISTASKSSYSYPIHFIVEGNKSKISTEVKWSEVKRRADENPMSKQRF